MIGEAGKKVEKLERLERNEFRFLDLASDNDNAPRLFSFELRHKLNKSNNQRVKQQLKFLREYPRNYGACNMPLQQNYRRHLNKIASA